VSAEYLNVADPMVVDIETFALDAAAEFIEEPSAPSNYKDPEKIAAYIAAEKAKAVGRCALDPDLCRVVAIGWGTEAGAGGVDVAADEAAERDAIEALWAKTRQARILIGFNLLSFDLPVLIRRSQYLGIKTPAVSLDRYRTPHIDLMERLSFNGKLRYRSLDFYCKRFGVLVADDHRGKDIDALVKAEDWIGVAAHCRADVMKTRLLAQRLGVLYAAA
jgi:DNA polymerase elongation subunit (family B)